MRNLERDGLIGPDEAAGIRRIMHSPPRETEISPAAGRPPENPLPTIMPRPDHVRKETERLLDLMGQRDRRVVRQYLYLDRGATSVHQIAVQSGMHEQTATTILRDCRQIARQQVEQGGAPAIAAAGRRFDYWAARTGAPAPRTRFDPNGILARKCGRMLNAMGVLGEPQLRQLAVVVWMRPPVACTPQSALARAIAEIVLILHNEPGTHTPDGLANRVTAWQHAVQQNPRLDLPAALRAKTGIRLDLPSNTYLPDNRPVPAVATAASRIVHRGNPRQPHSDQRVRAANPSRRATSDRVDE